jgi:hypothetical protein
MLALVGVVIGAVLAYLFQRSAAAISRREHWSDRASEALADVELLLTDAHPHRVTFNMNRDTVIEDVRVLTDRGVRARRDVAVLAVGYPDAQIRATARELDVAIFNADVSLRWLVTDMVAGREITKHKQALPRALSDYERATELKQAIVDRLQLSWFKRRRAQPQPATPTQDHDADEPDDDSA